MFFAIRARLTPRSIRTQLMLWYLVIVAGALAAFAFATFSARAASLERDANDAAMADAQALAREVRPHLLELDIAAALASDRLLDAQAFVVRERSGLPLFRSEAFPDDGVAGEMTGATAARSGGGVLAFSDKSGRRYRLATAIVDRPGARSLAVQTAAAAEPVRRTLIELATTMTFWFALVLAVASFGGSFIARRAFRPVDAIVARVHAIEASRLDARLEAHTGSEELDRLTETLNGMLDRLQTSMEGARRFAADASHELQTPIASLRAALECSLRCPEGQSENCGIAVDLNDELERLSVLIRDLRLLALADAGHLVDRVEAIDLPALVTDCCEIVRAIAEPRAISIKVDVLSSALVAGSPLHLRRALMNLAQNAVRYSPDGATVQLTVGRLEDEGVVAVVDEGCGIPPEDLPHIFERFYRADPARARDTGGSGLGLAIADHIARSHGGRIEVSSEVGRGSSFMLFVPALVPQPPADAFATVNVR